MALRRAWTKTRGTASTWGHSLATAVFWHRTLGAAVGVAALAGAGQLGVAYGLGLLRPGDPDRDPAWPTHLTWIVWFAALAVLAGAAAGIWSARRQGRPLTFGGRMAICLVGAVGAAVVLPLAAWPARLVTIDGRDAALEASLSTTLGVVIGLLAALAALSFREIAVSLTAVAVISWALALVSVAPSLDLTVPAPPVRLGVLDLPGIPAGLRFALGIICPLLVALSPGAVLIARARRATANIKGAADPVSTDDGDAGRLPRRTVAAVPAASALLALSYLIGGPGPGPEPAESAQVTPYVAALAALGAGSLPVLLMVLVRGPLLDQLSSLRIPRPSVRLPDLSLRLPGGRRQAESDSVTDPRTAPAMAGREGSDETATEGAPAESAAPPSEAEYVSWVKELAAGDDTEDFGAERRRLRPGSGDALRDVDLAPPPPPRADRDEV